MENHQNKGIGDYIIIAILGIAAGINKYGFEWYGLKAILYANAGVFLYAILVYIAASFKE